MVESCECLEAVDSFIMVATHPALLSRNLTGWSSGRMYYLLKGCMQGPYREIISPRF